MYFTGPRSTASNSRLWSDASNLMLTYYLERRTGTEDVLWSLVNAKEFVLRR